MSLNAGQVFVELGGKLDPAAFGQFEAKTDKAAASMEKAEARIEKASEQAAAAVSASAAKQVAAQDRIAVSAEKSAATVEESMATIAASQQEQAAAATRTAATVEAAEQRKRNAAKKSHAELSSTQKTWTNFAKGGQIAALALGAGVLAFAGLVEKATVKAAGFDQQLKNMAARTTITAKQLKQVRQAALDLGTDFGTGATEAAKAATELVKGGVSVRDLLKGGLKGALALAVAGEMDVADAATTVANALNEFHLKGQDATHVADALATAANATTADVKDFAMALSQGGAAAKTAGLSFDETTAFLEALASAGVKNSDAGTSMKTALVQLASPTAKASDLMKKLGLDFFDAHGKMKPLTDISGMLGDKLHGLTKEQRLQAATTLAGTDGMRALLALYDAGPKKIESFERGLKTQGTAQKVANEQNEGAQGAIKKLGAAWEQAQITVGEHLLPVIADGAQQVTAKLQEMAKDGSLDRMGADLAKIAQSLSKDFPDALNKIGSGVSHFGEITNDVEDAGKSIKFVLDLMNGFKLGGMIADPFQFIVEGARAALVAIKGVALAFDAITPGDQSGNVRKVQAAIDSLDRTLDRMKHKDLNIGFKVDQASEKQIFDLVDQLDKKGKKQLAIEITTRTSSAEAAIAGLKAALKGVPESVITKAIFNSNSAAEQVAALTALANGVPAKKVLKIQAEAKSADSAVFAFRAIAAGVPAAKVTKVLADTNSARAEIAGIIGLIASIPSSKAVSIVTTETHLLWTVQSGSNAHTVKPRGKAAGGKTSGPQMYLVGEGSDPVEWIIPRDPKYRSRAVGLLMDAAASIMPAAKAGAKTGPTGSAAKKKGGRFVPPKLNPIAYSVDQFQSREDAAQKARDDSVRYHKNLRTAQASLRDVERRNPKSAAQKKNKTDDLKRAHQKVTAIEKQISELPEHGNEARLRAILVERRKELSQAQAYGKRITKQQDLVDIARDAMQLADARGDDKAYGKAQQSRQSALAALRTLLSDAQGFAQAAGNDDFVRDLQKQIGQVDLDFQDSLAAITPVVDEAAQRESDTGMTDAERGILAGIDKNIALAALTEGLDDDTAAAQTKVDFLKGILGDALVNPARGGDTTIADLADQLGTATSNLKSFAGAGTNNNADVQAQLDQANERTRVAAANQSISDAALAAFQGFAAGGPGGLAPNITINTLHPGDPAVWTALAQTANAGNDLAPSRRPLSVKVGL